MQILEFIFKSWFGLFQLWWFGFNLGLPQACLGNGCLLEICLDSVDRVGRRARYPIGDGLQYSVDFVGRLALLLYWSCVTKIVLLRLESIPLTSRFI
ncbi:hypothetical protein Tco_0236360, partial [Tanacetum coccineum]